MKFSLLISLACTALPSVAYKYYSGPAQNFPGPDKWISFGDMFNRNKAAMFATGDTADDVGRIWMAIKQCAKIGVDERVILGIIMQESHGDVGAPTTYSWQGIPTGGIMQCSGERGHFRHYRLPQADTTGMICFGTGHFKGNLNSQANNVFRALREYNSGSVTQNNLSDGRGATNSYVSDVANRLQGWVN